MNSAFIDELMKIAATVQQLQQGFRRLGLIRVPRSRMKPQEILQRLQFGHKPGIGAATEFAGGVATLPPASKAMTKAQGQNLAALYRTHVAHLGKPDTAAVRAQFRAAKSQPGMMPVPRKVQIVRSKGGVAKMLEPVTGKLSPEGRKAFDIAMGHHEGFERAALRGPVRFGYGHMNPSVLAKEHNLLAAMEGPGAAEARAALQGLRGSQGDAAALSQSLEKMFGPRAAVEFGAGAKIPKAMRRQLERRVPMYVWGQLPPAMIGL